MPSGIDIQSRLDNIKVQSDKVHEKMLTLQKGENVLGDRFALHMLLNELIYLVNLQSVAIKALMLDGEIIHEDLDDLLKVK